MAVADSATGMVAAESDRRFIRLVQGYLGYRCRGIFVDGCWSSIVLRSVHELAQQAF